MKKVIITSVLILLFQTLTSAQEFEINKISEIAYAQSFIVSESIQIVENYLYFLTSNGLEIYEINEDSSINKLSLLTIATPGRMFIKDQYCYVISGYYNNISLIPNYNLAINKIDISNVYNPVIVDYTDYTELFESGSIVKFGDYIMMKWFVPLIGFYYDFYGLPELEYIGQVFSESHHAVVNDSLLVKHGDDGHSLLIEQYIHPNEFEVIGSIDISAYSDGNWVYKHFKTINDTIISAVNPRNITFWDISDASNWQYISRYTLPEGEMMSGTKYYTVFGNNVIIFYSGSLHLIDISDISNPELVDSIEHNIFGGQACDHYENNIYVGTTSDGIQHYYVDVNTIEYVDSYFEHKRFFISDMYESNIVTSIITNGYYLFDVEDPLNPIDLGEWFIGKYYYLIHKQGGWMLLRNPENYSIEVYDINDLQNPVLMNSLYLDYTAFVLSLFVIDESDPNFLYTCNYESNIFRKFDISEPGEPVELFEYQLPTTPCGGGIAVINSKAYITYGLDYYDLLVLDGLEENAPYIANDINNFTTSNNLDGQEGFLTAGGRIYYTGQVFSLDDPLNPELYFEPLWGTDIEIQNDLIFAKVNHIIGVYENRPNSTEPIAIINGLNYVYNIDLLEHAGSSYLITMEMANIGLFEYTYIPSSKENELLIPKLSLLNYPNPFNPSTTISYSIHEESKVELSIYNIKGQKIKSLLKDQITAGEHSIIWDGKDDAGKKVSSGVYLYKLNVNGKTEAVKKCLLLK